MISSYIKNGFITVEGCFDILKLKSKEFLKNGMATGCVAGRHFLAIKADGRYMPCTHFFEHTEKAKSLMDYWNNSMVLKKFRGRVKNNSLSCGNCARQNLCSPCRVMSICPLFTPQKPLPQFLSIYGFENNNKKVKEEKYECG